MKFYKYGIDICDARCKGYGGHSVWLANRLDVDYLAIELMIKRPKISHIYYEGYHHYISFGFFCINWGGPPFIEDKEL